MPIADLKHASYNPRTISEEAMEGLKASIDRFGLVQPIVWNKRTKTVIGGHQRLKAMAESGETDADVVVVSLPRNEEKVLNVALNSQTISGEFTADLDTLLEEIQAELPEIYDDILLDNLRAEKKQIGNPEDFKPGSENEQSRLDQKSPVECPHCGEKFVPR